MLIDMHVNANLEDGSPRDPRATLDAARKSGLDALLVVGRPGAFAPEAWLAARQQDDPQVFFGAEVRTARARFLCIPEDSLGDLLPRRWRADGDRPPDEGELLERMTRKSAAVIVAQPYERAAQPAPGDAVFGFDGIHAVEVRTLGSDPLATDLAIEAGLGMRLPCVAGSDAPGPEPELGRYATLLPGPVTSQSELAAALREGEAWPVTIARPSPPEQASRKRRRRR